MESPRKFNDCYFYYYSTCTKGDNCVFRHEPSALGCETMCTAWQQGKCLDKRCKLRHMELRKNRKQIPCYWENQPGGCRKKHCPFMHKNPDARTDGIAPSQPALPQPQPAVSAVGGAGAGAGEAVEPLHAPHQLPMLWQHQQQRQVVLDSAILGVLPASPELLGGRRVVAGVEAPNPYAPMPVDPLVVNFEEESDNESAPSSTPTKQEGGEEGRGGKSQELLLLERIQAEAAAFYSYEPEPPPRKPRPNPKYDRLSLDELAGKTPLASTERRKSLDFKVLSLEEIRARKKTETIVHTTPITLNLSRKRKLSTQETVTSSGNKIIKVVRSNSIVYKKVDPNAPVISVDAVKNDHKQNETESRKRTLSEQSIDIYDIQVDELVDDCHEFKKIKIAENISKPRLIRNRHVSLELINNETKESELSKKTDNDSDSEVQIVSVDLADTEIIDLDTAKMGEPVDIVDLSDDDDVQVTESDLSKSVPDVVASCRKKLDGTEKDLLKDIDSLLNDGDSLELDEDL